MHLFHKYAIHADLAEYRMQAIIAAQAGSLNAPFADTKGMKKANKNFNTFLDSLDPEKIEKKRVLKEETQKNPISVFKHLGITGA